MAGTVFANPVRKKSPAGIPHCYLLLEHRSIQQEAGLSRQAYCRLTVVASGLESQKQTEHLVLGSNIKVSGFLTYQTNRNGESKLVLHADNIIDI